MHASPAVLPEGKMQSSRNIIYEDPESSQPCPVPSPFSTICGGEGVKEWGEARNASFTNSSGELRGMLLLSMKRK